MCEAYYYLGAWYEAKGNIPKAKEFYRKCLDNTVLYFVEPPLARAALGRLGKERKSR